MPPTLLPLPARCSQSLASSSKSTAYIRPFDAYFAPGQTIVSRRIDMVTPTPTPTLTSESFASRSPNSVVPSLATPTAQAQPTPGTPTQTLYGHDARLRDEPEVQQRPDWALYPAPPASDDELEVLAELLAEEAIFDLHDSNGEDEDDVEGLQHSLKRRRIDRDRPRRAAAFVQHRRDGRQGTMGLNEHTISPHDGNRMDSRKDSMAKRRLRTRQAPADGCESCVLSSCCWP